MASGAVVDEATRMLLLDCCLFQLARHDFTAASQFADMTSLMQTEPMPSSISQKQPNALMQVAPLLRGNLKQPYKLFLAFDKSCSVYYYTAYRGATQIPKNVWDDPGLHNSSELRWNCAPAPRRLAGDTHFYTFKAEPQICLQHCGIQVVFYKMYTCYTKAQPSLQCASFF